MAVLPALDVGLLFPEEFLIFREDRLLADMLLLQEDEVPADQYDEHESGDEVELGGLLHGVEEAFLVEVLAMRGVGVGVGDGLLPGLGLVGLLLSLLLLCLSLLLTLRLRHLLVVLLLLLLVGQRVVGLHDLLEQFLKNMQGMAHYLVSR